MYTRTDNFSEFSDEVVESISDQRFNFQATAVQIVGVMLWEAVLWY